MNKDIPATPMEPFTHDEEAALFERLDRLSVSELESYIGSAKTSLGNRALEPTWRPRIELALKRAEMVHLREEAAAAALAAAPPVVVAPAAKAKKAGKADKVDKVDKVAKTEETEETEETDETQ